MSFSKISDGLLACIAGDAELAALFSAEADIEAMLQFEIALAQSQAVHGVIPVEAASAIEAGLRGFALPSAKLEAGVRRDGLAVPGMVALIRGMLDDKTAGYFHFGTTSQDAIDTSLMLRLKRVAGIFVERLTALKEKLERLRRDHGHKPLMARTRMQAALPITAGHRIDQWRIPLGVHAARLDAMQQAGFPVQLGGPTGTLDKLGDKGGAVRRSLAETLGLSDPGRCWHTDRMFLADWANLLSMVTGSLGKLGQDVALMSQTGVAEVTISGGGTSSAMPHKANPVNAELLVTLARFNAILSPALHHALIHEQERSGAAWTLEWMVFPQICITAGAATLHADKLLDQIDFAS
ncbi:MAG: 3-carboxy-cis,cis-muconate cycloisomerase [Hyphomicrobiales bacterium]|nr:3-carboxy-cis,cis-muconate cycloisomerase [Hyphomicrobiales bacterium]